MGKALDDLNLSDQPLPPPPTPAPPVDPRSTDWYQLQQEIDELLLTGRYDWAADTLNDIRATVERMGQVTTGQRNAVANIENSRRNGGSRRYEGFRRW